jgi:hypothetical protein
VSWLRRRRASSRGAGAGHKRHSLIGHALLLRRSDTDQEGAEILSALAKRYEVSPANENCLQYRVVIDDAYDPDEAVVRLASVLDEIDRDWEDRFGWPEAVGPAARDLEGDNGEAESPLH